MANMEKRTGLVVAYRSGAEYVVVFNYYGQSTNQPVGDGGATLKEEHFAAMEKFWTNVVQNAGETNRGAADAVLVLPSNYGGGIRAPDDKIWGYGQPDEKTPQVWNAIQNALANKGNKLDIVYEDPAYPVAGKYQQVYFWNQTG